MALHTFYVGEVWADRDVPWHYPWIMFAATVPVGLLALGLVGLWGRLGRDEWTHLLGRRVATEAKAEASASAAGRIPKEESILLISVGAFILIVFSWHGVPVYDGERLFLMVFPFWAIWVGVGARCLVDGRSSDGRSKIAWSVEGGEEKSTYHATIGSRRVRFERQMEDYHRKAQAAVAAHREPAGGVFAWRSVWDQRPRLRTAVVSAFVALQAIGLIVYYPCQLSYYNLLVGGLAGAERLGFEVTYWGDTVREPMLAEAVRLTEGKPVLLSPNLAPFQAPGIEISSPSLHAADVALVGWDPSDVKALKGHCYVIVYRRRADLADAEWILKHGRVVMDSGNQGVWLAKLVELDGPLDVRATHSK
jgi:hypothetical protein